MSKHTPGPWKEAMWGGRVAIIHDRTDDGTFNVVLACNDRMPTLADVRLIVAAPDLLAALKALSAGLHDEIDMKANIKAAEVRAARAAIAKAEGTQ